LDLAYRRRPRRGIILAMRNTGQGIALVAAVLIAVGGVGYVLWRMPAGTIGRVFAPSAVVNPTQATTDAVEKQKALLVKSQAAKQVSLGKHKHDVSHVAENSSADIKVTVDIDARPQPTPLPFPTTTEIRSGMYRTDLWTRFGEPSMRSSNIDRGQLFETYVYCRRSTHTATFARLQDGKVIAAHTTDLSPHRLPAEVPDWTSHP
jgi:hypothetical protein